MKFFNKKPKKTWTVAEEFNDAAHQKLGKVLGELGFKLDKKWHGVGGSQDISIWKFSSSEGKLVVKSETYIGLNVKGEPSLVDKVKKAYDFTP